MQRIRNRDKCWACWAPPSLIKPWRTCVRHHIAIDNLDIYRDGKSRKHCLHTVFEIIVDIFGWTTILFQFLPINAHKPTLISKINIFLLENIQYNENNNKFWHFYMLRNNVNLRTFFNPENWLADENQLFPCLGQHFTNKSQIQKCLKSPIRWGSSLFGTLSEIFLFFNYDASP